MTRTPSPRWPGLVARAGIPSLVFLATLAVTAWMVPHAQQESVSGDPAGATKARKEHEKRGTEAYLRALPSGVRLGAGDRIETADAVEWHLLTYPTGRVPPMAWDRARDWVARNVGDAPAWSGPPVNAAALASHGVIPPGINTWVSYGPQPVDSVGTTNDAYQWGRVAGRVAANGLAVDPSSPNVAYAAFAASGFWKTANLGSGNEAWTPLWDDKDFVSQAAGAVELDPTNPSILYVGTGDAVGRAQFSSGIMKSVNGGTTWTQLGASVFTPFSPTLPAGGNRWDNQAIKAIEVDPHQPSTVLVATRNDLYLSNDAGSSWQICAFGNAYTDPSVSGGPVQSINRVSAIYLDSRATPTVAYLAVGHTGGDANGNNGVYRFAIPASGCPAWPADFTLLTAGLPAGTGNGIPYFEDGSLTGRIELAGGVGKDDHLTLYAQLHSLETGSAEGTYVLRPDGGSTTWTRLAGSGEEDHLNCNATISFTYQDFFDLFVAVDPNDDHTLYLGHIDLFKGEVSADYSAIKLTNLSAAYEPLCPEYGKIHPDFHAMTFVPGTQGTTFLMGNDGGVYWNDKAGDVNAWRQLNDDFNTLLFYGGQAGADFAGDGMNGVQWLFGGMQDNGTASWDSTTADLTATARGIGGDGFHSAFDPVAGSETAGWWLSQFSFGSMFCSADSGADGPFTDACNPVQVGSADLNAPLLLDALHCTHQRCSNLLFGEDYVHAAGSYGASSPNWTVISPLLTKGGGAASIVALAFAPDRPKAAAAGTNDGKLWWTNNAYSGGACTPNAANKPTFSCTPNTAALWRDVDSTNIVLPNRAVLGTAFDPTNHQRLYAAVGGFDDNTPTTPGHVFEFKWNGSSWTRKNKTGNLPDVPAWSVAVNPHNRKQVFVGTSFGFYYTNNVDATNPNWLRYQQGLPNTIIRYLTIDRGPDGKEEHGTTLTAFTFGRGIFALRLPTNGAPLP